MIYKLLIILLDERMPKLLQNFAIKVILSYKRLNLKRFIQPQSHKSSWKNCAKILIYSGALNEKCGVEDFLKWIQDMNWPGAKEIFDYLQTISPKVLSKGIEKSFIKSIESQDEDWAFSLYRLYKVAKLDEKGCVNDRILEKIETIVNNY